MRTVFLVKQEEVDLARAMESKLIELPLSSGVLFAGVSVEPVTKDRTFPIYHIWVGCHRDFAEGLMDPLVRSVLREDIERGAVVRVEAHRGLSRPPLKIVDNP